MLIPSYCAFVARSDWTKKHKLAKRKSIAQYGLASEVGSLVSAVKKKLLAPDGSKWDEPTEEIIEELGDVAWYAAMLATLESDKLLTDILVADFRALPREIDRDTKFKQNLKRGSYEKFIKRSEKFISKIERTTFEEYQKIAILTSRTQGKELLHVCLTRLLFYSTVIMSKGFPQVEKLMQSDIQELDIGRALGMIMWHVAAVATVYNTALDEVIDFNVNKINQLFNLDGEPPTPLHDRGRTVPSSQRFPRQFDISFVSVGEGRLQMYYDGMRLGDELTDNYREDDGYRFHDIMHLSNAAKLGWSPVLRSLMGRKRKYDPEVDSTEDGARARIVEEAVVKAVHSGAVRLEGNAAPVEGERQRLFTSKEQIPFNFLKLIKSFVKGLEVEANHFWEWQEAIVSGHQIYNLLRDETQGTVHIDLNRRSISFDPRVSPALKGTVVGTGIGQADFAGSDVDRLTREELDLLGKEPQAAARLAAQKGAVLRALGLDPANDQAFVGVAVSDFQQGISVKATHDVQKAMWRRGAVSFQSVDMTLETGILCYAIALGDLPIQAKT